MSGNVDQERIGKASTGRASKRGLSSFKKFLAGSHSKANSATDSDNQTPVLHSGQHNVGHNRPPATNLALLPTPPLPTTRSGSLPSTKTSDKPSEPIHEVSGLGASGTRPICELWDQAYDDLRVKEEPLVKDYEATLAGNLRTIVGPTAAFGGSKVAKRDHMQIILKSKVEEVNQDTWKLRFGGKELAVKDLVQPFLGIVDSANEYIANALLLNPSKQAASLANGLEYISGLIVQGLMREELYSRRYESNSNDQDRKTFQSSHTRYRDTLKGLYTRVLKFQMSSICYLSKNAGFRLGLDIIRWEDWESLLADVRKQEQLFDSITDVWKDKIYEEECNSINNRHQETMRSLGSIDNEVSGLRKAVEEMHSNQSRAELLGWLSSVDPSLNYNKNSARICMKLIQSQNSSLWLHGKAGSGKSFLSSSIIAHLNDRYDSDPRTALAYFYFSFSEKEKQDTVVMLESLIKQLCCRRPNTPQSVEDLRRYQTNNQRPERKTLEATLAATVHGFSDVYLVIDALDECPDEKDERDMMLNCICRVLEMTQGENLHLLCTSRRLADIEAVLALCVQITIDLSTYESAVNHDIELYIDTTLTSPKFASWSNEIKAEVRGALLDNADGMFQYVACQFDILRRYSAPGPIRKALQNLPKSLDTTHDRMLESIDAEFQKQVSSLLKWLAFSIRPLSLGELAEVFILDHKRHIPFDVADRLFQPKDVLKYLPGLVVTFTDSRLYFPDSYVEDDSVCLNKTELDAHLYISESCLAYHLHLSKTQLATTKTAQRFGLWHYVADYWAQHLEQVPRKSWTTSVTHRAIELLTPRSRSLLNMVRLSGLDGLGRDWEKEMDELASPLYYAVSLGLQLTNLLISNSADVNERSPGGRFETALIAATHARNEEVVNLLLDNGADIDAKGAFNHKALVAIALNNPDLSTTLIKSRADMNTNALQIAAFCGMRSIVLLLLDKGADIHEQDKLYGSVLHAAALTDRKDIMQLLLDKGADINVQDEVYGSTLNAAIANNAHETALLLVERGAKMEMDGVQLDELLLHLRDTSRNDQADRLQHFRANPTEYLADTDRYPEGWGQIFRY